MKARVFKYAQRFQGEPKPLNFKLVEEELKSLEDNEILCEAQFWSVDPYIRLFMNDLDDTVMGSQVARIMESRNSKFPKNFWIFTNSGWRTHTVFNPEKSSPRNPAEAQVSLLDNLGTLSPSLALGSLGMPGNTAYFGFLELCQPQSGETVVVTGAAGAVGSLVGQIAKIKGCRVVGIAGGQEKCSWLTKELGFDAAIDYKIQDIHEALKETAPDGVDCYFDNVGGEISSSVIKHMNTFGRISVCGSISSYNDDEEGSPKVPHLQPDILFKQLKMEGFHAARWLDRWPEGTAQIKEWILEGKIKTPETITEGFENLPQAFINMLAGRNKGKAIVRAKGRAS